MIKTNLDTYVEIVTCPKHGKYEAKIITINDTKRPTKCPECLIVMNNKEEEENKQKKAQEIARLLGKANVPPRFKNKTFDCYKAESTNQKNALKICQAYADSFNQRLEAGGGLVLCGGPGTGKTHLSISIINYIIPHFCKSALFTSVMRITKKIKNTYSRDSTESEEQVFKFFTDPALLIIDELGVQFGSDTEKLILFELINTRYERMLPTILISNLELNALKEFAGERIIDRMKEGGGAVVNFDWESYRGKI